MAEVTAAPKFQGVKVFIDGRDLIVPSLSFKQFKDNYELLTAQPAEEHNPVQWMQDRLPIIGLAIRRNHPEISDQLLEDIVDLASFRVLIRAIQAASGMQFVKPGE